MTWRAAVTVLLLFLGAGCSAGDDGSTATDAASTESSSTPTSEVLSTTEPNAAPEATTPVVTTTTAASGEADQLEAMFTSQGYTADEAACMVGSMQAQVDAGDVVDDRTMIAVAVDDCGISDERIAELQGGAPSASVEDRWASALQGAGLSAEQARCAASEVVARYGETTDVPPGFDGDAIAAACGFDPAILSS
jgi:hypothetical protein